MLRPLYFSLTLLMALSVGDLPAQNALFDHWEATELSPGGRIDAIADLGDGVVVTGTRNPNPGKIFRSTDFGQTWKMVQNIADAKGNGGITCIARGKNNTVYLLTQQGAFWKSGDNGISWKYLNTITANKNKDGFAAAYSIIVTKLGTIMVTNTDSEGGHIYRSENEGKTWTDLGKISSKGLYRFAEAGKGIIVNGWEGKVYISYNDGKSWQVSGDLEKDSAIYATEYMGASYAIEASINGHIYVGNIWNNTWKKVATLQGAADDFAYLGNGAVIYSTFTEHNDIYLSLDYGKTWKNIGIIGTDADGDWLDHFIAIHTPDKVICIGGTRKGYIARAEIDKLKLYQATLSPERKKVFHETYGRQKFENMLVGSLINLFDLNEPEDVLVDGRYAYIPCRDGNNLAVVDISDPSKPALVSSFRDTSLIDAMGVAKAGNYVYVTSTINHTLLILDAKDPARLKKISQLVIGGAGGSADRLRKVVYDKGYVYLTHSSEGKLYICDVSDPRKPGITGSVATGDGAFGVTIKGDMAYVGGCFPGASLKVIDIRSKASPKLVYSLDDANRYGCLCSFEIAGNKLFAVAYSSDALVVFDISDGRKPREMGYLRSEMLAGPGRIRLNGNKAYVISSRNDTFSQIDISDPAAPRLVQVLTDPMIEKAYGLDYNNGYFFIAGRNSKTLAVLKGENIRPGEEGLISYLIDSLDINAPEDIVIRNGIAYIPCRDGASLTLLDISDSRHPRKMAVFRDEEITDAMGIALNGNYLYLTSMTNRTLLVLDIADPHAIRKISSIQLGTTAPGFDRLRKVVYRDGHLFVTDGKDGKLFIMDIHEPRKPEVIGEVETGDGAFNVYLKDNFAYIGGCGGTSLNVVDISDLRKPRLVKVLKNKELYSCLCSFSSSGNYLFAIGFYSKTFVVFDISEPRETKQAAIIRDDRLNGANRLYQHGDAIYIATALTDGMVKIDVKNPADPRIIHMASTQLLDKAYGITYNDGLLYVVGRDADSMVILEDK